MKRLRINQKIWCKLNIHQFDVTYESFQDFKKRQAFNEHFKSSKEK